MAIEQTLNKIERDIASGDYGKARDSAFAEQTLRALQSQVVEEHGCHVAFGKRGAEKYQWTPVRKPRHVVACVVCVAAVLAGLGLMVVGLVTVVNWIF